MHIYYYTCIVDGVTMMQFCFKIWNLLYYTIAPRVTVIFINNRNTILVSAWVFSVSMQAEYILGERIIESWNTTFYIHLNINQEVTRFRLRLGQYMLGILRITATRATKHVFFVSLTLTLTAIDHSLLKHLQSWYKICFYIYYIDNY